MYSLRVGGILRDLILLCSKNIDRSSILYYNVPNNGLDLKKKKKKILSCNNRFNLFWPFS
jgi:hypothetical protein